MRYINLTLGSHIQAELHIRAGFCGAFLLCDAFSQLGGPVTPIMTHAAASSLSYCADDDRRAYRESTVGWSYLHMCMRQGEVAIPTDHKYVLCAIRYAFQAMCPLSWCHPFPFVRHAAASPAPPPDHHRPRPSAWPCVRGNGPGDSGRLPYING
jgi:hypothetical protein